MKTKSITILALLYILSFTSCVSLKVNPERSTSNTTTLGVEWNYSQKVNELLQFRIDSALEKEITRFNSHQHSFTIHRKLPNEKDYILIDFVKGKVVSKGEKAAGYIISAIGLIAAPIVLIGADASFIAVFYYFPLNKLDLNVSYSDALAAENSKAKRYILETGALFARTENQVNKLITKFTTAFNLILLNTEKQLNRK